MTALPKTSAPVNRSAAETEARQTREALLLALRAASARTRLFTNIIDSVGTALRHKNITLEGAVSWLTEEGIYDLVQAELSPKRRGNS
jgi:hypothetical protein